MIQLYAITDASPPLPGGPSLGVCVAHELAALWAPATEQEVTPQLLWRHEQVVEELMADRDVLPVRYGTQLADEAAVTRILEDDYERLLERLEFVRGAAEVSVRAYPTNPRSAEPRREQRTTGAEYLRARRQELVTEREAGRAIHEPLAAVARAATLRQPSLPDEVLCAAYLLDHQDIPRVGELVAKLQDENPALRLTCTGPWPPYSFAER